MRGRKTTLRLGSFAAVALLAATSAPGQQVKPPPPSVHPVIVLPARPLNAVPAVLQPMPLQPFPLGPIIFPPLRNTGSWGIHGHVVFAASSDVSVAVFRGRRIELPDAKVTARNTVNNVTSSPVSTNAHGYYQLSGLPTGSYEVCASAPGLTTACLADTVIVKDFTVVVPNAIALPAKGAVIAGQVQLADKAKTPCFADRPAFRTFVTAEVALNDAGGQKVAGPVRGNGIGEYVLPVGVLPAGQYGVVATCQGGKGQTTIQQITGMSFQDIVIGNAPPQVHWIETRDNGTPVRLAAPGTKLTMQALADDPDNNSMTFKWVDATGTVLGGPAPSIQIQLPATPTATTVFVEASDGLGGFAYSQAPVTGFVLPKSSFTGQVIDSLTRGPIPNADVMVNGNSVVTDLRGLFAVQVANSPRYTISVHKAGYALLSKVTYSPAGQILLPIEPVVALPFDPVRGGVLTSKEVDKRGLGVSLTVPPNSLVDAKGSAAVAPARAFIWGYPPGTPIPGDMSAIVAGKPEQLQTFGAIDIVILDSGGGKLQVRRGAQLEVAMTPSAANPPPTIPFFSFDEKKGLWLPNGKLTLVGGQYHGVITHMTGFNADLAFTHTGCIEYHVDIDKSPALPFDLHIEQNGQSANHEPFQVSDFAGVVARLKPGVTTDWWALPSPTSAKADAIGHGNVLATDFTSNPSDPNGDFPGVGALQPNNQPFCNAFAINAEFPSHETYLTGLPGSTSPADEAAYRTTVDAWGASAGSHTTLSDFKHTNGFPNADEASAVYFNNGDLKLGRDMHCRVASGDRVACYVTNYSNTTAPPAGAAFALPSAIQGHQGGANTPFATVAMEWDPHQALATSVQFYVYNAAETRVNEAALDSEGPKPVPRICQACHGGSFDTSSTSDHLAHESRFLPFDIASFLTIDDIFSAIAVNQLQFDSFTRLNQLGQFRGLNELVKRTETGRALDATSNVNAVIDLIDGWYQGCGGVNNGACGACVGGPGCPHSFRSGYRPVGWQASADDQNLYDHVVRPACRGCHIMQPSFDWVDPGEMTGGFKSSIQSDVCINAQRRMPHAEVPFKSLWSGSGPEQLTQAPITFAHCARQ